jgi:hypothetical protein
VQALVCIKIVSKGIFPDWYKLGWWAGRDKVIVWLLTFTEVLVLKKYNIKKNLKYDL